MSCKDNKDNMNLTIGTLIPSHDDRIRSPFTFSSRSLLTVTKDNVIKMRMSALMTQIHNAASMTPTSPLLGPRRANGGINTYFPLSSLGQYVNHSLMDRSRNIMQSSSNSPRKWPRLSPECNVSNDLLHKVEGFYYGIYGGHGYEVINITNKVEGGATRLEGLKVIGDPNVPAGELTFRSTGPLEEYSPWQCRCLFHRCDCFNEMEISTVGGDGNDSNAPIRGLGRMKVECRTADTGFSNAAWNEGYMYFYEGTSHPTRDDYFHQPAGMDLISKCKLPRNRTLRLLLIWDSETFKISSRLYPMSIPL